MADNNSYEIKLTADTSSLDSSAKKSAKKIEDEFAKTSTTIQKNLTKAVSGITSKTRSVTGEINANQSLLKNLSKYTINWQDLLHAPQGISVKSNFMSSAVGSVLGSPQGGNPYVNMANVLGIGRSVPVAPLTASAPNGTGTGVNGTPVAAVPRYRGHGPSGFSLGSLSSYITQMSGMPELMSVALGLYYGSRFVQDQNKTVGLLGNSLYESGGSIAEVGTASMLSRALGSGPAGLTSQALQLANALHGGTYGAGYLRSHGVVDLGPTQVDKMSNEIKAINVIRNIKDEQTAIRVARDVGMSDDMWVRDLSQNEYDSLIASQSDNLTPNQRREHALANARWAKTTATVSSWWQSFKDEFINHPFEDSLGIVGGIVGGYFGGPVGVLGGYVLGDLLGAGLDWVADEIGGLIDKHNRKPNAKITTAPRQVGGDVRTSQGAVGLGPRGMNAVPISWKNQQMDDALSGAANRLGGYAL